jgi:hypothetical protein
MVGKPEVICPSPGLVMGSKPVTWVLGPTWTITALSLTRPAVARVFSYAHFSDRTHVLVGARIASVSGGSVHLRHPNLLSPLRSSTWCCPPVISSITIDHDEFFDLPLLEGGG